MAKYSEKEAQRLADMAGRGQNIGRELRDRAILSAGMRIIKPNYGESLWIWAMRTLAPDLMKLHPIQDVEVFPEPDNRRVDFSFLPIPVVIEVQGIAHKIESKLEKDCIKINHLQLAGVMVLCFTSDQLEANPWPAVEQVREALKMMEGKTTHLVNRRTFTDDYT